MPEVILAGAGCLDAASVTLEVKKAIQKADCILYDDLLDPELKQLNLQACWMYTGKRKGRHALDQEGINQLLIECAGAYKHVLRLKGGDPFVFGRGYEEAMALQQAGIPVKILPGLSSCIAIPEVCGIPVTMRGISSSFLVLTAHHRQDAPPLDFDDLPAGYKGTVVILMGVSRLAAICSWFSSQWNNPQLPAALFFTPDHGKPVMVQGTVSTLPQLAAQAKAKSPGIIMIGACAGLPSVQQPVSQRQRRIGSVATDRFAAQLASALEDLSIPSTQAAREVHQKRPVIHLEESLQKTNWLLFASPAGIDLFFDALKEARLDVRKLANKKIGCLSAASARVLEDKGLMPDLVSDSAYTADLARQALQAGKDTDAFLTLRSSHGDSEMEEILQQAGRAVHRLDLYDLTFEPLQPADTFDLLVFGSQKGVEDWFTANPDWKGDILCIGKKTLAQAKIYQPETSACSDEVSISSMASWISSWYYR